MHRLDVKEFKEKLESKEYTLLDIRTSQEQIFYGVISEKQIHIDIYTPDAHEEIKKLPREGKYLIYCWHGNRSQHVLQVMQELWFKEVYDLIGGIEEWQKN